MSLTAIFGRSARALSWGGKAKKTERVEQDSGRSDLLDRSAGPTLTQEGALAIFVRCSGALYMHQVIYGKFLESPWQYLFNRFALRYFSPLKPCHTSKNILK